MVYFGLGLGALLIVIGALTYWLAPKVGPNPWFGLRTGYSVANREVWDKSNRLGGVLFAVCGVLECLLTGLVVLVGADARTAYTVLFGWLIGGALVASAWGLVYSRRLALGTPVARELKAVPFRWTYVLPVLVSAVVLVAVALYFYPQLPAERLATHFDMEGNANGWMSRNEFMATFLALASLFTLLDVGVVAWTTREPLIAIDRLGNSWWMSPERGLAFMAAVMTFMNLFFGVLLWDTAQFNLRGAHLLPMNMFIWIVLPILVVVVAGFFLLAQRRDLAE